MGTYSLKWYIFLLAPIVIFKGVELSNDTTWEQNRSSKVNGRTVKLYSGVKHQLIECDDEGFRADPVECSTFYRCIKSSRGKYTALRFQCGPGTVYDPDTEICDHSYNTKRPECRSNRPFQFIPVPVDQVNYNDVVPVHELPFPITTTTLSDQRPLNNEIIIASTLSSSIKPVVPETPEFGAYVPINRVKTTINPVEVPSPESSTKSTSLHWITSTNKYGSTTSKVITNRNNECVQDGFMGDGEDCRKFYRCVINSRGGFIKYEFMCSESTVWDDEAQSCNHPWAVRRRRCGRGDFSQQNIKHEPSDYENNKKITEAVTIGYGNSVTEPSSIVNSEYSSTKEVNYGDRVSIDKVWNNKTNINNEMVNNQNRPESTHSLVEKPAGSIPYPSNETYNQIHESITTSSYQFQEVNHDYVYSTNQPINKLKVSKCTESGFMGDLNDCRKFYRCVENGKGGFTRHEFQCGEGTAWDAKFESCNHIWLVKECKGKISSNSYENYGTDNKDILNITPDPNYGYKDPEKQITLGPINDLGVTQNTLKPTESKPSGDICNSVGYKGDALDCKRFYRCIKNENGSYSKLEYMCDDGTVWDQNIEGCNHANEVKQCGADAEHDSKASTQSSVSTVITTISIVQTTVQVNNIDKENDVGYDSNVNTETTTKMVTVPSNKLNTDSKCMENGFLADNDDCRKFYRCVDNGNGAFTRYEYLCGEGTGWDVNITACNYIWAVEKCGNKVSGIVNESVSLPYPPLETTESENNYTSEIPIAIVPISGSTSLISSVDITTVGYKENICSNDGFIGDNNDCKKFYRCVSNGRGFYVQHEFFCGEGTVWDPEIEACNHAWAVKKCGGKIEQNDLSTLHSSSTTMSLIEVIYTTQNYNKTDSFVQNNVTPANEISSQSPITTHPQDNSYIENETTTTKTSYMNNNCTAEGFYGDENDCKKFYRCVPDEQQGFFKYEFICGEGTIWVQNIQACNHASVNAVNCFTSTTISVNTSPESTTNSNVSEKHPSNNQSVGTTEEQIAVTPAMASDCFSEGFYPNSKDCKKFFRCVSNGNGDYIRYDFSCGEGTIWVQKIQACDHDNDNSTCNTEITSVSESHKISTKPSVSATSSPHFDTTTNMITTESTIENNTVEDNDCHSEGYFPYNNDCRRFYRCVLNERGFYTKYDYLCGEGTAWDTEKQACNHVNTVKRCQNINANEIQSTSATQTESVTQTTEVIGTTKTSTTTTESALVTNDVTINNCKEEGYFGNKKDCQKFYRCVDNGKGDYVKYDYICGEGTIWDQNILACNHPRDVKNPSCNDGTTDLSSTTNTESSIQSTTATSTTLTPSSPISTQSTTSTSETNNQGSSSSSQETTTKNPNKEIITCTKAGFYPNPEDCKKFYRCVDWDGEGKRFSVFHFECGEGTIWDPALNTCNYEESVYPPRNCNGTQNTSSETTTTSTLPASSTTTEITTQTSQITEQSTTQSTTVKQTTTDETTSTQQSTEAQTTVTQSSTSEEMNSTTLAPTDSTSTTSSSTTSGQSTTDYTTEETSDKTTTTTEQPTTATDKSTTTTELSTGTTEQQTSSTEQTITQTTVISTESTTKEDTTTQTPTTEQQTSTASTTDNVGTSTTESSTSTNTGMTTESTQETTTQGSSSVKDCPETESDQYLYVCPTSFKRHPKYCNLFYQCLEDNASHELKIAMFNCPNGTIYDETKIQCIGENEADKKCQGSIATKRRFKRLNSKDKDTITVGENAFGCTAAGHYPFERNEECSPALLKCELSKSGKLQGFVYRCPENYVYWSVSRRCESVSLMTKCKHSVNQWSGRTEIPTERTNIAQIK